MEKMETEVSKEIGRLSALTGLKHADILNAVLDIKNQNNVDIKTALSVWKAQNRYALNARSVIARVVGIKFPSLEFNRQGTMYAFVKPVDSEEITLRRFFFGFETVELEKLAVNMLVGFRARLTEFVCNDGVKFGEIISDIHSENITFPSVKELSENYLVKLSNITGNVGMTIFTRGTVGKIIIKENERIGFVISDIGSDAYTVWSSANVNIGDDVIVFGYVYKGDTDIIINAISVF